MRRLCAFLLLLPLLAPSVALARTPAKHGTKHGRTAKSAKSSRKVAKASKKSKRRHVAERAVPTYTRGGLPNIQARAAVVVDMATGAELFQKNADAVRPIASVSKLMAMMVVLDRNKLDLDAKTTITENDARLARRGAKSRMPVGMYFTNRDLLHAALMASDNRAVLALGRAVGFEPEQLASEMNKKAKSLGLPHTQFGDPTGLDNRNQSTPREVVRMLAAALKYPLISEITRRAQYVAHAMGDKGRHWPVEYTNTDVYTRGRKFTVLGGKTGYTDEAGYCLAIAARLEGRGDVAAAFLGAEGKMTRFADFARAAQWVMERNPAQKNPSPAEKQQATAQAQASGGGGAGMSSAKGAIAAPEGSTVKASVTPGM